MRRRVALAAAAALRAAADTRSRRRWARSSGVSGERGAGGRSGVYGGVDEARLLPARDGIQRESVLHA